MDEKASRHWPDLAVVALTLCLISVPSLFTRDLWNPDEPRYMEVAREMAVLGEYVLPQLNGEVYMEKPPLFFWLAGFLWKAGVGYNSGRIVTILVTLGALLLVYFTVAGRYGRAAARTACFATLSTMLMVDFAKLGVLDPLLTFLVAAAVLMGWRAFHAEGRGALRWWCGCYAALGLGTLTKGPVGILVPGLVLLAYGLISRKKARAGGWAHLAGAAVYVVVVGGWLVPACIAGGQEYTDTVLFKQNLGRAVQSYNHRNPMYYYLVRFPLYLFPWSLIAPVAAIAAVRRWRSTGDGVPLLAALWLLVPIVLFSLISGKRMNYIVPVVPGLGVLTGWYLAASEERQGKLVRVETWLMGGAFVLLAVASVALIGAVTIGPRFLGDTSLSESEVREVLHYVTPARVLVTSLALAVPFALSVVGLARPKERGVLKAGMLVAGILVLSVVLDLSVTPVVNRFKSGRQFAGTVRRFAADSEKVHQYQDDFSGVYNLYTGYVRMPVIETPKELRACLSDPDCLIFADIRRIQKSLTRGEQDRYIIHRETVGHRTMVLLKGAGTAGRT